MAEKKNDSMTAINFRCSAELKNKLEILRFVTQSENISALLIELCEKFVEVNAPLIESLENARKAAKIRLPFEEKTAAKKKTAPRKKTTPQPINEPAPATDNSANDAEPLVDENAGDKNEN